MEEALKINMIKIENYSEDANQYHIMMDDMSLWEDFKYTYQSKGYNYALQRWTEEEVEAYIATWKGDDGENLYVHKGFAIYLLNTFGELLDEDSINLLKSDIYADQSIVKDFNFEGLRDDQSEIVKEILKYKRGIVQVATGFGKTEIIARIAINFVEQGKHILITTGLGKVIDEIKLRIWKYNPDMYIPDYWDTDSLINIINPKGFANSYVFKEDDPFFHNIDLVLCDEVSSSTSESSWAVLGLIDNQKTQWLGFDATADVVKADRLDIRFSLDCIHSETSVWVIDYFGMSWIYSKPKNYKIDIIEVVNKGLREINSGISESISSESSIYRAVCAKLFSHPEYIYTIEYILKSYGRIFIPINDLTYINTLCEYFQGKYHIITITGEGYWSSIEDWIDLDRVKYLTSENKVDLLLTSSAGFKGLDFHGIPNIVLTLGTKASQIIQMVGRVARQNRFRVLMITAGGNWKIPVYTKHQIVQLELLLNYYSECIINEYEDVYD